MRWHVQCLSGMLMNGHRYPFCPLCWGWMNEPVLRLRRRELELARLAACACARTRRGVHRHRCCRPVTNACQMGAKLEECIGDGLTDLYRVSQPLGQPSRCRACHRSSVLCADTAVEMGEVRSDQPGISPSGPRTNQFMSWISASASTCPPRPFPCRCDQDQPGERVQNCHFANGWTASPGRAPMGVSDQARHTQ